MNIAVIFRAQLQAAGDLGVAVLRNLEDLIRSLTTWGQVEHNEDGTHASVTADTAVVAGRATVGRLRMGNIVTYTAPDPNTTSRLDNLTVPGLDTAGVLKIRNTASGVSLTGINATGFVVGDLLLVINDDQIIADPTDMTIAADDANSTQGNRFIGGAASGFGTFDGSEGVWLMYDTYTRTGTSEQSGWRVIRLP